MATDHAPTPDLSHKIEGQNGTQGNNKLPLDLSSSQALPLAALIESKVKGTARFGRDFGLSTPMKVAPSAEEQMDELRRARESGEAAKR